MVSYPDSQTAAADRLHHRYAERGYPRQWQRYLPVGGPGVGISIKLQTCGDLRSIWFSIQSSWYQSLSPEQRLGKESFLNDQDVFVSLPTETGKSLCYWVLPGVFNKG